MFEQKLEDMTVHVWFDIKGCEDADQEGIGIFSNGFNLFSTIDALTAIAAYDSAIMRKHFRAKRNRLIAQRNAIVTAFGPEMADIVGFSKR